MWMEIQMCEYLEWIENLEHHYDTSIMEETESGDPIINTDTLRN